MTDPAERSAGPHAPGLDAFIQSLGDALLIARDSGVPHLLIGGVAVGAIGRPRWTRDIDLMVGPRSARELLHAFEEAGYETEEREPMWLFKAHRDGVVIDLIFRSQGGLYLDEEMLSRSLETTFHGVPVRTAGPEDLAVMKIAAHFEQTGHQWFDALDLLSYPGFDWAYFERRTIRCVRRAMALLLYAQSLDIHVPRAILASFWQRIEGDQEPTPTSEMAPRARAAQRRTVEARTITAPDEPLLDDMEVTVAGTEALVMVTGELETRERRGQMLQHLHERYPDARIEDRTTLRTVEAPRSAEAL